MQLTMSSGSWAWATEKALLGFVHNTRHLAIESGTNDLKYFRDML